MDSTNMREHIRNQGVSALDTLETNRGAVEDFAECAEFDRIIINGAGDKYLVGLIAEHLWRSFGREPIRVIHSRDLADNPPHMDENTLAIFLSQSGKTADTMAAARVAADKGAQTLTITNLKEPLKESLYFLQDHDGLVLNTKTTPDVELPTPSTVTFHSTLSLLWHILAELAGKDLYKEIVKTARVTGEVSRDESLEAAAREAAGEFSGPRYVFGDGPRYGLARKLALIMFMEGTKVNAFSLESEEFLHSAIETLEEDNPEKLPLVLFLPPEGAPFHRQALKIAEVWDDHASVLTIKPPELFGRIRLNNLFSVQPQMVFGEWLAYYEATARGVDPGVTSMVKKVRSEGF